MGIPGWHWHFRSLNKEREVKDTWKCDNCGKQVKWSVEMHRCKKQPNYNKGQPSGITATGQNANLDTHTVELTDEERNSLIASLEYTLCYYPLTGINLKSILAKLKPKKESAEDNSVEREITEAFDAFYKDVGTWHPVFENYPNQTERMLRVKYKKSVLELLSKIPLSQDFDALIAAYEARKDEVR
jgi:hypothetical protein